MDILIKLLTEDVLKTRLPEFIGILADEPGEYWNESHFMLPLKDKFNLSIVALKRNIIAGYIIASLKESGPYIHKFMVKKEFRGKSLGTKMLDYFEKNIMDKGYSSILLSVKEDNEPAILFYKKRRFKVSGARLDSTDNSRLVTMSKIID